MREATQSGRTGVRTRGRMILVPNRIWICIRVLAGPWMLVLAGAAERSVAATITHDCSTTVGWVVVDGNLQPTTDAQLSADEGLLVFEYTRDTLQMLAHLGGHLSGFSKLAVRVRSKQEMMFGAALRDQDGARFYAMRNVPASEWTTVEFSSAEFELANTSPVAKDQFDPKLAQDAYVLLDIGSVAGFAAGPNTLEVDWVEITREAPPTED